MQNDGFTATAISDAAIGLVDAATDDLNVDVDEVHLDGLRRLGLPVVQRRSLDDRMGAVHRLPGEEVSLEDAAVVDSTRAKYRVGWIDWCAWCDLHDVGHYDADPLDVRRWLEHRRRHLAVSTVQGRLAAVSWWYERAGRPSPAKHPTIRRAMTGYARIRGTATRHAPLPQPRVGLPPRRRDRPPRQPPPDRRDPSSFRAFATCTTRRHPSFIQHPAEILVTPRVRADCHPSCADLSSEAPGWPVDGLSDKPIGSLAIGNTLDLPGIDAGHWTNHLYAVTTTPFNEDLTVDWKRLRDNVARLIDNGVRTITVNGNTGEFFCLTVAEARHVVEHTVEAVSGRAAVVAGVGHDVDTAIDLATHAESIGCAAVMIHSPTSPYVTAQGFDRYVRSIATSVSIGVIPYIRAANLSTDDVVALASISNTVAVKYAVNDPTRVAELTAASQDAAWCCGTAELWAPTFFVAGASTFTSGLANVAPRLSLSFFEALRSGDRSSTRHLWQAIQPFEQMRAEAMNGFNVSVVKEAMHQLGYCEPFVRAPSGDLDDHQRARIGGILEAWERLGFLDLQRGSV